MADPSDPTAAPRWHALRQRVQAWAASTVGRRVLRGARWLFVGGVLVFLGYRLTRIGWGEVMHALPTTPWFYVTILVMYVTLPLAEALIYGAAWGTTPRQCLPVLLRKRVLNTDVVGYSGEVYLLAWAKQRLGASTRALAMVIKDNLVLSSALSLSTAAVLLASLLLTGQVAVLEALNNPAPVYLVGGGLALTGVLALLVRFRRTLFFLPARTVLFVASVHGARFLANYVLQVVQWWVVAPEAPFSAWATLLALFVVMNRIPLLPSRDLLFAGAGIELAASLGVPTATVAGMLLVRSGIERGLNLSLFAAATFWERRYGEPVSPAALAEVAPPAADEASEPPDAASVATTDRASEEP